MKKKKKKQKLSQPMPEAVTHRSGKASQDGSFSLEEIMREFGGSDGSQSPPESTPAQKPESTLPDPALRSPTAPQIRTQRRNGTTVRTKLSQSGKFHADRRKPPQHRRQPLRLISQRRTHLFSQSQTGPASRPKAAGSGRSFQIWMKWPVSFLLPGAVPAQTIPAGESRANPSRPLRRRLRPLRYGPAGKRAHRSRLPYRRPDGNPCG